MPLPSLLSLAFLSLLLLSSPAMSQQPQPPTATHPFPQTITATGTGLVSVPPDQAIVSVGVSTTAATSAEAQQKLSTQMDAVVKAIKALAIADLEVQTQWMNLNPVYNRQRVDEGREPKITGYSASNTVKVTIPDITRAGPVIDAATTAGANQVLGISFGLKSDAAQRTEALRSAATDARQKAEAIASALNLEVVRVLEATTGEPTTNHPYRGVMMMSRGFSESADAPAVVEAGKVTITTQVTITLEVRNK